MFENNLNRSKHYVIKTSKIITYFFLTNDFKVLIDNILVAGT